MSIIIFQQNQSRESACWRMYGTWSAQPTCEKLKFVKHCRNCDVFENAARQSLEKNEKPKAGLTAFSIEELIEKEKTAGDCSALPFRVGNHCFAIPSTSIVTITDTVAVHSIPYNKNPVLKGLVAINNEIYSLINIFKLLELDAQALNATESKKGLYKRVLVVNLGQRSIAFYVDEVYQIHRYFEKFLHLPEGQSLFTNLSKGLLDNFGQWTSDCYLLNLPLLQSQFEQELK